MAIGTWLGILTERLVIFSVDHLPHQSLFMPGISDHPVSFELTPQGTFLIVFSVQNIFVQCSFVSMSRLVSMIFMTQLMCRENGTLDCGSAFMLSNLFGQMSLVFSSINLAIRTFVSIPILKRSTPYVM